MKSKILLSTAATLALSGAACATTITTEFNSNDGFSVGGTSDVTVQNLVTFSGGQGQGQSTQTSFPTAYNNGSAAYLFINGSNGFNGASSTGDTGLISILGAGATEVSFHAANLANGPATTFTSFDASGNQLESFTTLVSALNGDDPNEILTFSAVGGVNIASIQVNLPGPASTPNPPYAASIDTFSATVVVPEPSSALLAGLALIIPALRRRR